MAAFELDFPDDFMKQLFQTDSAEICMKALEEAAPILEEEMKNAIRADGHELSGELINSIKATKPKKTSNGAYIVSVRPTGYSKINSYSVKKNGKKLRKYPVSNALKMIWIEYGVNGRQPARPFMTKVMNSVRTAAMNKMQVVYNRMAGAE
ncbi:MAG: HK97 gp10 family phage protein [Lachnospiraceae bacterium]|nr:HK97 gp10 family phage protein [Lachnospiraceae bacterium]